MRFITDNWVFQNIMPWIGIWFTLMTIIYYLVVIVKSFTERLSVTREKWERFFNLSIVISLIPFLLVALIDRLISLVVIIAKSKGFAKKI